MEVMDAVLLVAPVEFARTEAVVVERIEELALVIEDVVLERTEELALKIEELDGTL